MTTFNLLDEPWIPSTRAGDNRIVDVGIREALGQASAIGAIGGLSPLATIALHRLLLAILHRVFGPHRAGDWTRMWEAGEWDEAALNRYFDGWPNRFDLFDDAHPFYQCRSLDFADAVPVAALAHELAAGNNDTLFDHTTERADVGLTPAQAARYLVVHQAFAVGGLVSFEKGRDRNVFGSSDAAPLTKGASCLVQGEHLFQTLMLNLHHYDHRDEEPFAMQPDDAPAWERDDETQAADRLPKGYLDLLTWQSRRLRLQPDDAGAGTVTIRRVVRMKGNQFPDGFDLHAHETMQAFRKNPTARPGQQAWNVISFREDRAIWRDSLALFQSVADVQTRPKMLDWLQRLKDQDALPRRTYPLTMAGLATDRAKVFFWRQERLPLTVAYLDDPALLRALRDALQLAEHVALLFASGFDTITTGGEKKTIPRPLHLLGQALASPADDHRPDPDTVRRLVAHLAPGRLYWSRLDPAFRRFLIALAADRAADDDGDVAYGATELPHWADDVERAASAAFRETVRSLDTSARTLKAVARAQRVFSGRLTGLLRPFRSSPEAAPGQPCGTAEKE